MTKQSRLKRKGWNWAVVPAEVFMSEKLTSNDVRVYAYLQWRAGTDDHSWPGVDTIVRDIHISAATIKRAFKNLIKDNWIRRIRRVGGSSYTYIFEHRDDCLSYDGNDSVVSPVIQREVTGDTTNISPMIQVNESQVNENQPPPTRTAETYKQEVARACERGIETHRNDFDNGIDLCGFPEEVHDIIRETCGLWGLRTPGQKGRRAKWIEDARELKHVCGELGLEPIRQERQRVLEYMGSHHGVAPYTYKDLGSLIGPVGGKAAEMRTKKNGNGSSVESELLRQGYVIHKHSG